MSAPEAVKKLIETFGNNPDILQQLTTQLAATDRQIDRLVYKLYNFTEEEIGLVEGNG